MCQYPPIWCPGMLNLLSEAFFVLYWRSWLSISHQVWLVDQTWPTWHELSFKVNTSWSGSVSSVLYFLFMCLSYIQSPRHHQVWLTGPDQALGQTHLVHKTHPTPKKPLTRRTSGANTVIIVDCHHYKIIADIVIVITDVINALMTSVVINDIYSSFIGKIRLPLLLQFVNSISWKTDSTNPFFDQHLENNQHGPYRDWKGDRTNSKSECARLKGR